MSARLGVRSRRIGSTFALLVASALVHAGETPKLPPAAAAQAAFQTVQPMAATGVNRLAKGTLDKIREYGVIYVGYAEASIPFSYMIGDAVVGYSWDLCQHVVSAVRRKLNNSALKIVPVPVPNASRDVMLMTGVIDLECGATANTTIRQQSVAFGITTFVSTIKALTRVGSGIEEMTDLKGKQIVTVTSTTIERLVKTALAARGAKAVSVTGRDYNDAFRSFESGKADAFVLDDVPLMELLARSPNRGKYKVMDQNFGFEPYGIVLRRDDPEFKKLVDDTLTKLIATGEMEKLYSKWFISPIPPDNIVLGIPIGEIFKVLLANPNDKGN